MLDICTGGDNEVQRTMLEIVNQLDGFDSRGNIKVLMATNRPDTLDPALLRPGRLDRKVTSLLKDRSYLQPSRIIAVLAESTVAMITSSSAVAKYMPLYCKQVCVRRLSLDFQIWRAEPRSSRYTHEQ